MSDKPITTLDIRKRKHQGPRLVMVTAYDATFAALFDRAGADILLVGDSLGMVIQGHPNTLPVTLEHVLYHTAAVARGTRRAHLVADLPFLSYQVSAEQAVHSAGRLLQEGAAHAVKLEGGERMAPTVERLVAAGIPVMGHVGLTPQSVHALGGFRVQGREAAAARQLLTDAQALAAAGCYAIVLESIPAEVAHEITAAVAVPTIGIGAGPACDGQVLVGYDLLGMNPQFKPKFVKHYADLHGVIGAAFAEFQREVQAGTFPAEEHTTHATPLRLVRDEDEDRLYGAPM